jgi:hypothetical protein
MENSIKNAQLKFNCPVNWEKMEDTDGGKNCHVCQKKVFDLTNCSQDEMDVILLQNNYRICAKFTATQMCDGDSTMPFWKKYLSAAMILLGLNFLNNKVMAQKIEVVSANNMYNSVMPPGFMGEVRIFPYDSVPQFPGGVEALNTFLKNNLSFKDSEKDVYVSFDIDTMGMVKNFRILRGLKPVTSEEVAKIVKMSPQWKPAFFEKKPIAISYTLQIAIDKGDVDNH